jgi:hypothetical protein
MKLSILALPAQSRPRHLLLASAALLVIGTAVLSLKSSPSAHAGTRSGTAASFTASPAVAPLAPTSAIADPALERLIDLHRGAAHVPGELARLPQGGACCAEADPH